MRPRNASNQASHNIRKALTHKLLRVQRKRMMLMFLLTGGPLQAFLTLSWFIPNVLTAGQRMLNPAICPALDLTLFADGRFPDTFSVADKDELDRLCVAMGWQPHDLWSTPNGYTVTNRDALAIFLARLSSDETFPKLFHKLGAGAGSVPRMSSIVRWMSKRIEVLHGHRVLWSVAGTTPARLALCQAAILAKGSLVPNVVGFVGKFYFYTDSAAVASC